MKEYTKASKTTEYFSLCLISGSPTIYHIVKEMFLKKFISIRQYSTVIKDYSNYISSESLSIITELDKNTNFSERLCISRFKIYDEIHSNIMDESFKYIVNQSIQSQTITHTLQFINFNFYISEERKQTLHKLFTHYVSGVGYFGSARFANNLDIREYCKCENIDTPLHRIFDGCNLYESAKHEFESLHGITLNAGTIQNIVNDHFNDFCNYLFKINNVYKINNPRQNVNPP